jgi:hypothetical protein
MIWGQNRTNAESTKVKDGVRNGRRRRWENVEWGNLENSAGFLKKNTLLGELVLGDDERRVRNIIWDLNRGDWVV